MLVARLLELGHGLLELQSLEGAPGVALVLGEERAVGVVVGGVALGEGALVLGEERRRLVALGCGSRGGCLELAGDPRELARHLGDEGRVRAALCLRIEHLPEPPLRRRGEHPRLAPQPRDFALRGVEEEPLSLAPRFGPIGLLEIDRVTPRRLLQLVETRALGRERLVLLGQLGDLAIEAEQRRRAVVELAPNLRELLAHPLDLPLREAREELQARIAVGRHQLELSVPGEVDGEHVEDCLHARHRARSRLHARPRLPSGARQLVLGAVGRSYGDERASGAEVRPEHFLLLVFLHRRDGEAQDVAEDGEERGLAGARIAEDDVAARGEADVDAVEVAAGDADAGDPGVFGRGEGEEEEEEEEEEGEEEEGLGGDMRGGVARA